MPIMRRLLKVLSAGFPPHGLTDIISSGKGED